MKRTIINKPVSIIRVFALAIVFTILLPYNTIAQNDRQLPIQPENYLYLPSFKNVGIGLDLIANRNLYEERFLFDVQLIGDRYHFDSVYPLPLEAVSQKFMIDSTITIYGVALYRKMSFADDEIKVWEYEDSIQIRSLDHDTVYRSISIAHYRRPDFLDGVFEYDFDSLTISTPFTIVRTFSRNYYRDLYQRRGSMAGSWMWSTTTPLDRQQFIYDGPECHSFQRPSFKHYGDPSWYDMREDPHYAHGFREYNLPIYLEVNYETLCEMLTDSLYTDLFMLPIYTKTPEPIYSISVSANQDSYGTVSEGGTYEMFTYITLEATANENYRFVRWQDGNRENPRTIRVMSDSSFVAIFDTMYCSLDVLANDDRYGTVIGGGYYDPDSYVTFEAIPNENYRFVCWENDICCDNPRTIKITDDTTFVAIFDTLITNNIDMAEINEGITIHPNPATTILNIELPQSCTAELRNIKGVLIETKPLQANATQWNIEALPPGVYMLTLRNNDWVITRKFVKK